MEERLETSTSDEETTLECDDKEITVDSYVRRVGDPRRRFFARWTVRPGFGSAGGVAGRADARRTRRCARLEGAPDGAALGADSVARGRRRHACRHLQAVRPSPDRQLLGARMPRGLRYLVLEPGSRTSALRSSESRQEDDGAGDAAGCRLGDAGHERPPGRRRASGRPDAVHARGHSRRLGYVVRPAHVWGGATAGLRSEPAGCLPKGGASRPGYRADLRRNCACRGARCMGRDAAQATRRGTFGTADPRSRLGGARYGAPRLAPRRAAGSLPYSRPVGGTALRWGFRKEGGTAVSVRARVHRGARTRGADAAAPGCGLRWLAPREVVVILPVKEACGGALG